MTIESIYGKHGAKMVTCDNCGTGFEADTWDAARVRKVIGNTVTVDQVMSWMPCRKYSHNRITKLFAGREALSALNVLELDIPASDKLWAVLREEMLSAEALYEFACRVAEHALMKERKDGREPDLRSWAAIAAKRKWLRGEITNDELDVARAAARDAAWAVARDAAWAVARAAAWDAARAAARDAARDAAWATAVSWAVSWAELVEILKEIEEER